MVGNRNSMPPLKRSLRYGESGSGKRSRRIIQPKLMVIDCLEEKNKLKAPNVLNMFV